MNITLQTLEPVAFFNEWKVLNAVVRDKFHRPVWFKTYAVPEYEDDYLLGYEIRTYGDFHTASVFTLLGNIPGARDKDTDGLLRIRLVDDPDMLGARASKLSRRAEASTPSRPVPKAAQSHVSSMHRPTLMRRTTSAQCSQASSSHTPMLAFGKQSVRGAEPALSVPDYPGQFRTREGNAKAFGP